MINSRAERFLFLCGVFAFVVGSGGAFPPAEGEGVFPSPLGLFGFKDWFGLVMSLH